LPFDNADPRDVSKDADLWEKALRKLRGGMIAATWRAAARRRIG
jgi:hypothetical protein